ncbi:MAG: FAD-dependent oxidoreductase [Rhodospirillaceae bacterium]|nr:FAD-dependent oxidoreductase [Rhodospirillaceae bacterium]
MVEHIEADICVIGAGSGGLSVAAGASQMGASTVLFERDRMGGDCLNFGCVPSKALLAAAKAARQARGCGKFGVTAGDVTVDFPFVRAHLRSVIATIEPMDSVERFEGLGVRVIQADARFVGDREVEGGGIRVKARRVVVATGSSAMVPPIPGLDTVPYLTNETIFDLEQAPEHLIVIGGGPIGIEMAHAFRGLGSQVTVVEMTTILNKDDPELVDIARRLLRDDGVDIREGAGVVAVASKDEGVSVELEKGEVKEQITGSHIIVAAGRRANVDGLDLEAAGIRTGRTGIEIDARLRTSNHKIFAIGDVAGPYQFTHMAGYQAGIVIRNALFRLPAKAKYTAVPWVTYMDPELAQVGMSETEARAAHGEIKVVRWPFAENDRAQADRSTDGLVKVITTAKGHILGVSILGPHAGELIQTWCLAIQEGLKIGAVASMIAPYPTLGEINKRVAGSYFTPQLFNERVRGIVRFLAKLG